MKAREAIISKKVDHSKNIHMIHSELERLSNEGDPKLLIIAGPSGVGKTVLAKALEASKPNIKYMCVSEAYENNNCSPPSFTRRMTSIKTTYLLDEIQRAEKKSFDTALYSHIKNGGVAVLFVQPKVASDIIIKASYFSLTRKELLPENKVKAHYDS